MHSETSSLAGSSYGERDALMDPRQADALVFLKALTAAQKIGEVEVQSLVRRHLERAGCVVDAAEYDPAKVPVVGEFAGGRAQTQGERTNVVGRLKGDPAYRSLLLFAHPDSEPLADLESWKTDPFDGTVKDGRFYGWGVADDLAGVAAATLAIERAASQGIELGDVIMASVPSKRHARGVAAVLHDGLTADASLYLHPAESGAGLNEIKAFASGHLEFRITVEGKLPDTTEPGHTAFAHLAINPVDKAMLVIAALKALDVERSARVHNETLDAAVGRSTNLMISNLKCGEDGRFGRVNDMCVIGGAVSFPPGEAMADVQAEIEQCIALCASQDAWLRDNQPTLEWVSGVTGAECPPDHPFYQVAAHAVLAVTGAEPHVNPMHTSSDIRNPPVQKGIPTVGLGGLCGDLSQNGLTDEWIDLDDYFRTIDVTAAVILGWCGSSRAVSG
ncbi:M20/M25/M40 family metallo-hydrolase [Ahrensia marina]|uniref:M20/M25/M40 family metallo-hydrolase n=1 Tax=Ahrensia marina TaxID=1514904 RepID=UPI0035CF6014